MNRPDNIPAYDELDLKLGIKSSLPHVKSTIALSILLWESANRPAELIYSKQNGNIICLTDETKQCLIDYLANDCENNQIELTNLISVVEDNQLFKSQMEALIVAFELVWKLARVTFVESGKPASSERTGGTRYAKKLLFSLNADIIDCLIQSNISEYKKVLLSWIGFDINAGLEYEKLLAELLMCLSENAVFKLTDANTDIIFNQNSVYQKLLDTNEPVDISGDKEAKGSLRIFKSLLSDEMNLFLKYSGGGVSMTEDATAELSNYQKRVDTFLQLSATKVIGLEDIDNNENAVGIRYYTGLHSDYSRNRIVFGAPGTGKSYTINRERKALLGQDNETDYERVTFHPDYSYANFVGTYKPVPCKDEEGRDAITYEYVPGPFMRVYTAALKSGRTDNPKPYLLIIEEINRANVAAVFGDVFQLLDRGDDNVSEYPIQASEDMKAYLARELGGNPDDYSKIRIPDNMFIWATMNSADQGVFPMDTAFKRRWDFTYIGIDDNDAEIAGKTVVVGEGPSQRVEWNKLRKAINHFLTKNKINEDKQLGPYFIARKIVVPESSTEIDKDKFAETFKNKVIMYLFEDAAKQKRPSLFEGCFDNSGRYSDICREFDQKGIGIFNHEIQRDADPEDLNITTPAANEEG